MPLLHAALSSRVFDEPADDAAARSGIYAHSDWANTRPIGHLPKEFNRRTNGRSSGRDVAPSIGACVALMSRRSTFPVSLTEGRLIRL